MALGCCSPAALVLLVLGLVQGPRLNWFDSPMITLMIGGGAGLMVLFMINEWFHPLPFFKLQLLAAISATRWSRWVACCSCCWR